MTQRATLYIDQGTDFLVDLDVFDDEGFPLDLTGYSASSSVRKVYSTTKIADFTLEIVESKIVIEMPAETSESIVPGKYQYDVFLLSPQNVRTKILEGLLFILPSVTRLEEL